jgi:hypothetical protein
MQDGLLVSITTEASGRSYFSCRVSYTFYCPIEWFEKIHGIHFSSHIKIITIIERYALNTLLLVLLTEILIKAYIVHIFLRPKGTLFHDVTKKAKRRFFRSPRDDMKKQLRTKTAATLLRERNDPKTKDKQMADGGNITALPNRHLLGQMRHEVSFRFLKRFVSCKSRELMFQPIKVLAENDLDKYVLLDLVNRKRAMIEEDKKLVKPPRIPGYVQNIAADPFVVTMYSEKSFDILKRLLKTNPTAVLHLDSTGRVCSKLPAPHDRKTNFYYAVVVHLPDIPSAPVVPVLEFISGNQTVGEILQPISSFLRK